MCYIIFLDDSGFTDLHEVTYELWVFCKETAALPAGRNMELFNLQKMWDYHLGKSKRQPCFTP